MDGIVEYGTHAARPAANTLVDGSLYTETDTNATFQSHSAANTWSLAAHVPVIYLAGYSPDMTGVNDGTAAFQAAVTAVKTAGAGVIEMPEGILNLQPAAYVGGTPLPRNCPLTLRGQGKFQTTIKLGDVTHMRRLFDFTSQTVINESITGTLVQGSNAITSVAGAQAGDAAVGMLVCHPYLAPGTYIRSIIGTTWTLSGAASNSGTTQTIYFNDFYRGIRLEGFTLDANFTTTNDACLLGSAGETTSGGAWALRYYVSVGDLEINDVRIVNGDSVIVDNSGYAMTTSPIGVGLVCNHHHYGEPWQSVLQRIKFRDFEIYGCNTGAVINGGGGQLAQQGTTLTPNSLVATDGGTGGAVPAGNHYYRVQAFDANGHPCRPSWELTYQPASSTHKTNVAWTNPFPSTTLSAAYTAGGGTISLTSAAGFPNSPGSVLIAGITGPVQYTGVAGSTLTGCSGGSGSAILGAAVTTVSSIQIYHGTSEGWYTEYQTLAANAVAFTDSGGYENPATWTKGNLFFAINCLLDEIDIDGYYQSVDPGNNVPPTLYYHGCGLQCGSLGYGGRLRLNNIEVFGAGDSALEFEGFDHVEAQNIEIRDALNNASLYMLPSSFPIAPASYSIKGLRTRIEYDNEVSTTLAGSQSFPESTITVASTAGFSPAGYLVVAGVTGVITYTGISGPTTFIGCSGGTGASIPNGASVSQSLSRSAGQIKLAGSNGCVPPRHLRIEDYRHLSLNASLASGSVFVSTIETPDLELVDVSIEMPNLNQPINAGATMNGIGVFSFGTLTSTNPAAVQRIMLRDVRCEVAGNSNGVSMSLAFLVFDYGNWILDVDNFVPVANIQGLTIAHDVSGINFGAVANTILEGTIRGYRPVILGDWGGYAWTLGSTSVARRLKFENSDLSGINGSSSGLPALTSALPGKVYAGGGFIPQAGWPPVPYAVTPPASGVWQQHAEGIAGKLWFTGGTGTQLLWSPDNGTHAYVAWNQAAGSFTNSPPLDIEPGGYYQWIGTAAPTVMFASASS